MSLGQRIIDLAEAFAADMQELIENQDSATGEKGEKGDTLFKVEIVDGDLIAHYAEGSQPPALHINNGGDLIYAI